MTEVQKPWASFGYEPVPYLTNRRIARYLRTQRKNMRRFFEERGMLALADRMNQIRKSRQGMLGKNKMFQEVLNLYAQQSMPARSGVLEAQTREQVQNVRQDTLSGVEESKPREGGIEVYGVEEKEPRQAASDPEQTLRLPDSDAPVIEEL